jgi:o-succinylbenzoate---CoA ligase
VDTSLESSLQVYKSELYGTYGMTETISHIALRRLNGANRQKTFQALEGVQLSTDQRGCLVIKAGYLGQEPIVTNDIVELPTPKEFKWLGRVDFVINSGGLKVMPEKVEADISALMPDGRFFIHGFPHKQLGQQVCLIVEGSSWSKDRRNLLLESIKSNVSKYEVPKQILFVEKFVLAGNEKINRRDTAKLVVVE